MRRAFWVPVGLLAAVALALWGVWTWRLNVAGQNLANVVEADRQRNFNDMAFHVEQIQSLLGKGLVTGTTRQNMRYMGEVYNHSQAAVNNFTSLPLPAEVSASVGKFLRQTGDFAVSTMRNEAAGRELDNPGRNELARLRDESVNLSTHLQGMMAKYNQGGFRWSPPVRFSWASLWRGAGLPGKPATGSQAPASILAGGGWEEVGTSMQKLPVMVYDGPFSDHVNQRAPAVSGAPVSREEADRRLRTYLPNAQTYRVAEVVDVAGPLPSWSYRLAPSAPGAGGAAAAAGTAPGNAAYTTVVEISRNGGFLVNLLNSRATGKGAIDLPRARDLGREYLEAHGFRGMVPTYGQVQDGAATIAYAYRENGVLVYPDQVKIKVALDNGEILAVDARQYLMAHHPRTLGTPNVTAQDAQEALRPELQVQRAQLALIPNQAGTGEILTYEFLTTYGEETFLVYINANTGEEEQILQQVQTDGGTFAL
jgi:spore germination protein